MARVYSKRLFQEQAISGSHSVTVPVGVLWVVRDADLVLAAPFSTGNCGFSVTSGTTATIVAYFEATSELQWFPWRGRQVLNAGDLLTLITTGTVSLDATVSGYELTFP